MFGKKNMSSVYKTSFVWAKSRSSRFVRDDSGSIIVLSLFLFTMMLIFAGTAVDMVRHETTRVKLQNTVDRAILAAADLDQQLDPEAVVQDYFLKAGMSDFLTGIEVVESLNFRSVTAMTAADVDTMFILNERSDPLPGDTRKLSDWYGNMGDRVWAASAGGTAEEGFQDIEISLVLDVSGSMNSYSRIQNLKVAAKEFIDTILIEDGSDSLTTVSIVPYSAVVNVGQDMAAEYNLNQTHNDSYCPIIPTATFDETLIDPSMQLEMIAHFEYGNGSGTPINRPWCPTETYRDNKILLLSSDPTELKDSIDSLEAYGNTAIDLGMKWGASLLDPGTRPVIDDLIDTGYVSADSDGRPFEFGEQNTLKVVVLMTDGKNTTEYDIQDSGSDPWNFKSGMSNIWVQRDFQGQPLHQIVSNKSRFSFLYDDNDTPDDHTDDSFMRYNQSYSSQRWLTHPHGYDAYDDAPDTVPSTDTVTQISWAELYATYEAQQLNYKMLKEPYDRNLITYNEYRGPDWALTSIVNGTAADARLSTVCEATRDNNVVIYTIAFEAPTEGEAALLDCATSAAHAFDVDGTDIGDAFASIASDITQLRLTH